MRMEVCLNQKSYGTESVRKARASFDNCGQGNLGEVPGIGVGMGGGGGGWLDSATSFRRVWFYRNS